MRHQITRPRVPLLRCPHYRIQALHQVACDKLSCFDQGSLFQVKIAAAKGAHFLDFVFAKFHNLVVNRPQNILQVANPFLDVRLTIPHPN